jgi:hypothetical protein
LADGASCALMLNDKASTAAASKILFIFLRFRRSNIGKFCCDGNPDFRQVPAGAKKYFPKC